MRMFLSWTIWYSRVWLMVYYRAGRDAVLITPGETFKHKKKNMQVCFLLLFWYGFGLIQWK